jgi:glucose-6-phosphate isomerase
MTALIQSAAWRSLQQHQAELSKTSLAEIILADPVRLENCQIKLQGLRLNYALQYVTPKTIELLLDLARQQKIEDERARMWRGEKINATEGRAALHVALRQKSSQPMLADGKDVIPDVHAVREKMTRFTDRVRDGSWKGATGKPIKHIVNIGIGGSDLGPRMVVKSLVSYASGPVVHFAANVDAADLLAILKDIDPAETLFVVVSKTFTTQETLLNARTARQWVVDALGDENVAQHFVAVSTNINAAEIFGINSDHIFPLWDWVGGRFSLWSAVGLSIMLSIGSDNFDQLCDGAAAMDAHFKSAPLDQNMPVLLGLLGVWQRNFMGAEALAILPYCERLLELPHYLQQLDMESNGKSVTRDGEVVDYATSPIIFGERGTVGQHSFHQWLHQGTEKVPVDFVGVVDDDLDHPEHHRVLLANMTAQAGAFAFGRADASRPQDIYQGGRSSNLLVLDRLDPYHLGLLIALYEHKIFVQGIIWNINSFDQPGVELGKQMAKALDSPVTPSGKESAFVADILRWISAVS